MTGDQKAAYSDDKMNDLAGWLSKLIDGFDPQSEEYRALTLEFEEEIADQHRLRARLEQEEASGVRSQCGALLRPYELTVGPARDHIYLPRFVRFHRSMSQAAMEGYRVRGELSDVTRASTSQLVHGPGCDPIGSHVDQWMLSVRLRELLDDPS